MKWITIRLGEEGGHSANLKARVFFIAKGFSFNSFHPHKAPHRMTTELKIGDLVQCFDTKKSLKIHKFHPVRYDIVMVNDVNDAMAGFLYVEVKSLVKLRNDRFQSVHVPGSTDSPDFLRKYYSV